MWDLIHWALFLFNFFNKMFLKENGVDGFVTKKRNYKTLFFFVFFWLALALISHTFSLHFSARSK